MPRRARAIAGHVFPMCRNWVEEGERSCRLLRCGQFKSESGAGTQAIAVDPQGAAHFLGGIRATMEAKAVAVFLGGETMIEDAIQIFRRDAHPIIADGDF